MRVRQKEYICCHVSMVPPALALVHSTFFSAIMAREDRSREFTGVLGFFLAICTLLVGLRCYCKLVIVKNFAADDYFSLLTLVR